MVSPVIGRPRSAARRCHALILLPIATALLVRGTSAQQRDSTRAGVSPQPVQPADSAAYAATRLRDTVYKPPISPGKALLRSFIVPGWGQASLHRSGAGALYFAVSIVSTAMVIDTRHNLHLAERAARDSFIVSYGGGDPANGIPDTAVYGHPPLAARVSSRRLQVEDWTALLVFTHLISGFDAFVAAHLWDVPAEVGLQAGPDGRSAIISARFHW
jgi:hypothetical protein